MPLGRSFGISWSTWVVLDASWTPFSWFECDFGVNFDVILKDFYIISAQHFRAWNLQWFSTIFHGFVILQILAKSRFHCRRVAKINVLQVVRIHWFFLDVSLIFYLILAYFLIHFSTDFHNFHLIDVHIDLWSHFSWILLQSSFKTGPKTDPKSI